MTQREKLLLKLANHDADNGWTFADVEKLLRVCGYTLKRVAGSHHVYGNDDREKDVVLPRHGSKIKAVYVKELRQRFLDEK